MTGPASVALLQAVPRVDESANLFPRPIFPRRPLTRLLAKRRPTM